MHFINIVYALAALAALRILQVLFNALVSPLRSIPGPFVARFTKLWYLKSIYTGHHEQELMALHRRYAGPGEYYAPVVRLAPNLFSFAKAEKQVYGIASKMPKNSWYEGWKHPSPERWTLFTDRNIKRHAENRRIYANLYSMSTLVSYEQYVDDCTNTFQQRLQEIAAQSKMVDMSHWFQCYAFDVIGAITYGRPFGFLDKGEDFGNTIRALDNSMGYSSLVGVYAWTHPYLYGLLEWIPSTGAAARTYLMKFASHVLAQRKAERAERTEQGKARKEGKGEGEPEDFVDKMLDMREDGKKGLTEHHVFALTMSNIVAGSDTTATSLSAILYNLIATPAALQKLRDEVEQFTIDGRCGKDRVGFKASQEMSYLQACIKEGLRVHPAVGLIMGRVVSGDGATLAGHYFPARAEVGVNAWLAHYNKDIWGPDAGEFKPERWLDAEKEGGDRLKVMEANYMPFGLGSRTCIGKHISILEISKLIPQIVRAFDFELAAPKRKYDTSNFWFVKPSNFQVLVKRRI